VAYVIKIDKWHNAALQHKVQLASDHH